ncbi:AAA family ATPase [Desertifilum sp. FACHB-1129]|uniref:histidine kinase n=1 Tax=Desertifilum tharense IPPAS B-1220 TaxID=1781255 RepID=A0A1E5QJL1_9CYAN|nr:MULTISPECIES: ATP-binding sensor histidine kinase [Desertifilum]MDA0211545.1 AAA family ATPase [Cyanobacteria bacterium FC1]MBD2310069.1 AAA family ATPase [Desertifilum sp. FACHB-1129]MBD2322127.1 AAA family ATPase [Desertifilum sp. FACHB-866]MBD2333794.1 AAA family ATPase [Desertifilum sp. FACHB-868]OEJ74757.1 serine/threonine protein kinase [Desertifilum tharense IPPAS B-1220]
MNSASALILGGHRYSDLKELYCGSKTKVYRARRDSDRQPAIVKILQRDYPSFSELLQFRNQYALAKNLCLPGVVVPYSLEPYHHTYAIVMEDFGGISLKAYTQTHALALAEVLAIALQLADILHGLYQHRVIHKDIKPANILINPHTRQVKLIDFSISSLLSKETQEIKNPQGLEGTLAYLAPEQTGRMNRGIDYKSDFYALGVTLFELLTGQLPFQSNDPIELVHCHIAKTPPTVQQLKPQIPAVVSEIVSKLMAKNAENRYQSALGLKHDLEECLKQLQQTGQIADFAIARRDICDRFIIPEKLYGREGEVQTLLQAFDRVAQGGSELMLVAGFSGIGKTAVINEIHKPIVRQRGYFIKGKFDQFNRNIPFGAFVQAFRDLMGQLLSENERQLQIWKAKILEVLGENAQVIIDAIPELEWLVGKQPPIPELSGNAAQNRFNLLFQKFIAVFATQSHPLVLFIDDWQWADSASLQLIRLLMGEVQPGYLLLLGAYRDNEVSPGHPFMLMLEEVRKQGVALNAIFLKPLSLESLNQLVSDTLGCQPQLAQPLTELVYQKTKGNPFFATQFLKALHQDGLITFNLQAGYWQCDIAQIRNNALTDDVVAFMAEQLQKLPTATQKILKLAACIGNLFDLATLAIVSQTSESETAAALWQALQEGLVLPQSEVYKFYVGSEQPLTAASPPPTVSYRFLHDRVQQAAYSLIPEADRAIAHYQIGQLLLQQISPEAREERIFTLVNQLNYGIALIADPAERDELAQLNLIAGHKARAATAYQAAREYATIGLSLLDAQAWQRHYSMSLKLHELAVEVAWLCSDFEQMDRWIEGVIEQAKTPFDQVRVYHIKIQSLNVRNAFTEAIAIGKSVLQLLGMSLPDSPTPEDIEQAKVEIDGLIGDRDITELVHLPKMTDPQQFAIMQIVDSLLPSCYLTHSPLHPLLSARQVKLSIQFGNCLFSSVSYASYALHVKMIWQDMRQVQQFGELAYRLAKEPEARNTRAATFVIVAGYVHHCTNPLRESLPIFQEGYQAGLEAGDLAFVVYSVQVFALNAFWSGQPLNEFEAQIRAYHQHLTELKIVTTGKHYLLYWEMALILLGYSEDEVPFRRVAYEEELTAQVAISRDSFRLCAFYLHRFVLNFWLGDLAQAQKDGDRAQAYLMSCAGTIGEPVFYFYDSLTLLATLVPEAADFASCWQRIQENQVKLKNWADYAPMNHQHKYDLVEAEKCRVLQQRTTALELYDRAIQAAKENRYLNEEAIANELAAKFYLDWGKQTVAAAYLQEAYYAYARWGAKAIIARLETQYPHLLKPILQQRELHLHPLETIAIRGGDLTRTRASSSSNADISTALDFAAILRAAQAISSNIELDELIANLTRILLENSGASKTGLILPEEEGWKVCAIASLHDVENPQAPIKTTLKSQPLVECAEVPQRIIQYVKNTQEQVLINRLETNISGLIGDYMLKYQPQSILCLPLLNQGHLVGVLYLENQLAVGAFSSERLQVINFLASQVAISLENAKLYQQAQQALQNLQHAQLQIIQSEKMSALGNLVAGVAHEINNPVGFIGGNIQPALDYVGDLFGLIDLYQQEYPQPRESIQSEIEAIDLDYVRQDLPKLIESMRLGINRISEISHSLRTFSRADRNYQVPFNLHEGIDSTLLILKHRLKANDKHPEIQVIKQYGDLPLVHCYPGQLNQVFMNILANAIDALEESNHGRSFEEIQVHSNCITIQTQVLPKGQVSIRIADNGIGMAEAVKQCIFDHLFTTKTVGRGTGLGLAIARQIVEEKHLGQIEVNSQPGQGTEFTLLLPISGENA